jgi:hypothetical protein
MHFNEKKQYIVRSKNAGVFYGYIESVENANEGATVTMRDSRRIWHWQGAASLSQLSQDGTSKPNNCKFPCRVASQVLFGVIEINEMTDKAVKSLDSVPVWRS